jgi:hypothetical protein
MRRRAAIAFGIAFFLGANAARAENPWEEIMGRKPRTWAEPNGRFTIDLPVGWTAEARAASAGIIEFWRNHPDYGQTAHVTVEMKTLPPGVKVQHFAVRVTEDIDKVAKNVTLIEEDRLEVSGRPAIRRYFTHQEKAHAELTNEVVQVIFVVGERGFVVTLETAYGARPIFWEDFGLMIKGFVAGAPGDDMTLRRSGKGGRKKLKAGEMVNPDGVPY